MFQKSISSLNMALAALDLYKDNPPTDRICVECQMAAEFSLKSFLMAQKHEYRKFGHDLGRLVDACSRFEASFGGLLMICERLGSYKEVTEYDLGEGAFPSLKEARLALENARKVQTFVRERLKALGFLSA